jgi:hypothetical protein
MKFTNKALETLAQLPPERAAVLRQKAHQLAKAWNTRVVGNGILDVAARVEDGSAWAAYLEETGFIPPERETSKRIDQ